MIIAIEWQRKLYGKNQKTGLRKKRIYNKNDYKKLQHDIGLLLIYERQLIKEWDGLTDGDVTIYLDIKSNHDIDSLIEVVLNAGENVIYKNDKQVNRLHVSKEQKKRSDPDTIRICVIW
jgi:hypothetical protein